MRVSPILLALSLAAASAPAFAQSGGSSFTLQNASAAPARLIFDGVAFVCQGASCTAGPGGVDQPADRACRRLVAQHGPVSSFSWQGQTLSSDRLAACNGAAGARAAKRDAARLANAGRPGL